MKTKNGKNTNQNLGFVIIGRNEGKRLEHCITSILPHTSKIVYVDSDSNDGSLEYAQQQHILAISLDLSIPFSAARARNEGWTYLARSYPELEYVHFIDGDCYLVDSWLDPAVAFLKENPEYAIVCGQRKELHPETSIYNALCDNEWNTPAGDTESSGGDFIIRRSALEAVDGFRNDFIAGEEPEMCFRLRHKGYKIYRYNAIMTMHDARIIHFSQWWSRTKRCGYAFALSAYTHGCSDERFKVREIIRSLFWGAFFPTLTFLLIFFNSKLVIFPLVVYVVYFINLLIKPKSKHVSSIHRAFYLFIGKFAEAHGAFTFAWNKVRSNENRIIEYK